MKKITPKYIVYTETLNAPNAKEKVVSVGIKKTSIKSYLSNGDFIKFPKKSLKNIIK